MKTTISGTFIKVTISFMLGALSPVICGQANSDGSMPQYLFGSFSDAAIRMKNGQIQNQNMNYNTLTGKMVFVKGDKFYDLSNPGMVDTITMGEGRFVPVGNDFYEVICEGVYSLYIQHTGSLMQPGKPVGYGGTSQLSSTNYISNVRLNGQQWNLALPKDYAVNPSPVFWIRKGTEWFDFTTVNQMVKLFPDKSAKMKDFIKANKVKPEKPESMKKLVEYMNTL